MNLECNIQLENCLIYLNDEHWSYIVRKLNYVDKISLGRTCSRFFNLISTKEICYLNEQFKFFFESSLVLDDYITYVCGRFRLQFYHHYFLKVDRLYLAYFLSILKEKLTCRLICGHMFWCHRKNVLDSECKICYQVFRCDEDPSKKNLYSNDCLDFWDTHAENVYVEETYLEQNLQSIHGCKYFENFYTREQLVNFFGVIRMFLNLGKIYLSGKFQRNKEFYRTYAKYANELFNIVCGNVRNDFVGVMIYQLKPYVDYDPKSIKITNEHCIEYLEKKLCI